MDKEEDLLDSLLAVAAEELEKVDNEKSENIFFGNTIQNSGLASNWSKQCKTSNDIYKEIDIFQSESNLKLHLHQKIDSLIHNGDADLSDDEGNRKYEDKKCNEYGQEIQHILSGSSISTLDTTTLDTKYSISPNHYSIPKRQISTWKNNPRTNGKDVSTVSSVKPIFQRSLMLENKTQDVFMDPIFGMRIVNPLVSSSLLTERMQGRLAVRFGDLSRHNMAGSLKDKDWVICGVIVSKSPPKTTQKGSQYSVWTLSDLKDDLKTHALFLFSSAHKDLWKTAIGTVIGVLNPNIMDQKDVSKNEVSLSLNTPQKVMIFGQSKDFGICKSIKKNGEKCTAIVNLSKCEYCIYHIKQEYQKCSKRSELQANFAGQGLVNLRNKVLGKNEIFYAGKSYMAIPAKKSKKLETKNQNILQNLNGMNKNTTSTIKQKNKPNKRKGVARHIDVNPAQRARDLKLLGQLGGTSNMKVESKISEHRSNEVSSGDSKALNVPSKLKVKVDDKKDHVNQTTQFSMKNDIFTDKESKTRFLETLFTEKSESKTESIILKLETKKEFDDSQTKPINHNNNQDMLPLKDIEDQLIFDDLNSDGDSNCVDSVITSLSKKRINYENSNNLKDREPNKSCSDYIFKGDKLEKILFSTETIKNDFKQGSIITPKCNDGKNHESLGNISPMILSTEITSDRVKKPQKLSLPTTKDDSVNHNDNWTKCTLKSKRLSETSINLKTKVTECTLSTSVSQSNSSNENSVINVVNKSTSILNIKSNPESMVMGIPILSGFRNCDIIDLNKPIIARHIERAKINAIKFIQRHGPIKKIDPNNTKGPGIKKRNIERVAGPNNDENPSKKSKLQESEFISDRFKKMMAMTSKHAGLLEQYDNEEKEKYFKKLEIKEQMEEKMMNTHKVKCKAVRCLQCKYTSFSASELCKTERHSLKVFDAMKRFYKCSNCQNRSVTLELVPTRPCTNCGSSAWRKTGMMKDKIAAVQHNLSIRGGEQKFVNSVITDANLDLLVPDDQ